MTTGPGLTLLHIGFDGIPFRVRRTTAEAVYPDWNVSPVIVTRHIPGSNTAVVQHMGTPPATLTLGIAVADVATYRALMAKLGTTGTLTLLAYRTSATGRIETLPGDGRVYEHYDDTLLAGIANVAIAVTGRVEADVTFQRAFNPATGGADQ